MAQTSHNTPGPELAPMHVNTWKYTNVHIDFNEANDAHARCNESVWTNKTDPEKRIERTRFWCTFAARGYVGKDGKAMLWCQCHGDTTGAFNASDSSEIVYIDDGGKGYVIYIYYPLYCCLRGTPTFCGPGRFPLGPGFAFCQRLGLRAPRPWPTPAQSPGHFALEERPERHLAHSGHLLRN